MTRIMNAYQFTGHENNAELRTMISNLRAPLGDAPLTNLSEYARRHGCSRRSAV
jgi:hypothetical protein